MYTQVPFIDDPTGRHFARMFGGNETECGTVVIRTASVSMDAIVLAPEEEWNEDLSEGYEERMLGVLPIQ